MQDFRWALRSLRRSPGFAALAIFALVLGIGAAATAFTVLDTVLLRPLPYRAADRLVFIREMTDKHALLPPSYPNFASWRERARSFDGVASAMFPFSVTRWPATTGGEPVRVSAMGVSQSFFRILGVRPLIGREFTAAENTPGGPDVEMVSYEFWQERMGGRQPLGSMRGSDGAPIPVVGVLPPGFRFVAPADVFFSHDAQPGTIRSAHNYMVVARLSDGATLTTARAEMTGLSKSLLATYGTETQAADASVVPLRDYVVGSDATMVVIVFGAAALVLLIACTNLISAQLARGRTRAHEIVVRAALGARRGRLVRQLMYESAILVAVGAVGATALTVLSVRLVKIFGTGFIPRLNELGVDGRVLAFVAAIAAATTMLVGIYPAVRLANRDAAWALRGRGHGVMVRAAVWRVLVGFEVALAVMLLVGAALLVQTLHNIVNADTGFDARNVVTASLSVRGGDSARLAEVPGELAGLPGVEGVAYTNQLPFAWNNTAGPVRRPTDPLDRDWPAMAGFRVVSPEYFSVLREPMVRGRAFSDADRSGAPEVAIVTPGIAAKLWPGEDPIGKQVATNYLFKEWLTVVGVVAEASSWSMPRGSQNEIFVPLAQHPGNTEGQLVAVVRTAGDPQTVLPVVRQRLRALLPGTPAQLGTMDDLIDTSAADRRFAMLALTAFGAIALLLAAVGIYGVIWYIAATRTHEIGIRMALGATAGMVRRDILGAALMMAGGGISVGIVGGVVATRYLESVLYGVSRLDPRTYLVGAVIALVTAVLAADGPARRSSRIDPVAAIREEA
jgi:predicted permease